MLYFSPEDVICLMSVAPFLCDWEIMSFPLFFPWLLLPKWDIWARQCSCALDTINQKPFVFLITGACVQNMCANLLQRHSIVLPNGKKVSKWALTQKRDVCKQLDYRSNSKKRWEVFPSSSSRYIQVWPPSSGWVMWCLHPGQWLRMMRKDPEPPL